MSQPRWRPRRVAWLLTHASLRSAEVPLLRSLGCEVWVQKAFPVDDPGYRSCSADLRWDEGTTLPADALAELNAFDFYSTPLTARVAQLLNEHFELAIIDPFPIKTREVLASFRGPVLVRAFGREAPHSYSDIYFLHDSYRRLTRVLRANYRRFWFSVFYPEVAPHEVEMLRRRSFHLPITLPEAAWKREGTWQGGGNRILFVCPSINDHPDARKIYDQFKRHFGDLPHIIVGRQFNRVNDPNVAGYLAANDYNQLYQQAPVMYYHSREPRHLHYHPVEAMASGMPVVYLRGGLLEKYDQGPQAGACDDEIEAHDKLNRLLKGDTTLLQAIHVSQQTVVKNWRPEIARRAWQEWFDRFQLDAKGMPVEIEPLNHVPPSPTQEELYNYPYLDPSPFVAKVRRELGSARRYFQAALAQRTLLPHGLHRLDEIRRKVRRWLGRDHDEAA